MLWIKEIILKLHAQQKYSRIKQPSLKCTRQQVQMIDAEIQINLLGIKPHFHIVHL